MNISIVIPVHNEEQNVSPLLGEIRDAVSGRYNFEIIYVDDNSADRTVDILKTHRSNFPQLKIIRLKEQCGQSTALRVGVQAARYPVVVTLDGDGQNDPADIERLIQKFTEENPDYGKIMVIGHRQEREDSRWRKFISRIANTIRSTLLHDNSPDSGCGIKIFARDLFLNLPHFDHMHRFLPSLVQQHGGTVTSIAVKHRKRVSGHAHYGTLDRLWAGIFDLMGVIWLGKRKMDPVVENEWNSNG